MTTLAVLFIDRIERRIFLRFGLLGIFICLLASSAISFFIINSHTKAIMMIISLLGFIIFFSISPGAMVWTIMSEILPSSVRSFALSLTLFMSSMAGAILSSIFLPFEKRAGFAIIFLLFAIFTMVYFVVSFFIPKTKGRTLEEIESDFSTR